MVVLGTVAAFAGLHAWFGFQRHSSPVLRSVRGSLALGPVARVLLLESPAARELVRVQDVQDGEGRGPVAVGTLERGTDMNHSEQHLKQMKIYRLKIRIINIVFPLIQQWNILLTVRILPMGILTFPIKKIFKKCYFP